MPSGRARGRQRRDTRATHPGRSHRPRLRRSGDRHGRSGRRPPALRGMARGGHARRHGLARERTSPGATRRSVARAARTRRGGLRGALPRTRPRRGARRPARQDRALRRRRGLSRDHARQAARPAGGHRRRAARRERTLVRGHGGDPRARLGRARRNRLGRQAHGAAVAAPRLLVPARRGAGGSPARSRPAVRTGPLRHLHALHRRGARPGPSLRRACWTRGSASRI